MRERAQRLAVEVLAYLAGEPDQLQRFFDLTGASVDTLRQVAGTRAFQTSLLDFLASDEALLIAFAVHHGYDPGEVGRMCLSVSHEREAGS